MNLYKAFVVAAVLGIAAIAGAGEKQWVCSITDTIECSEGVGCGPPQFAGVKPPSFLHVDADKKVVTLLAPPERRGETNPIDSVREVDGGWILAGNDGRRSWSIYVSDEGNMTLSVTMDGTTWTAFGRSMPAADAQP